jgi:hypothetical protein
MVLIRKRFPPKIPSRIPNTSLIAGVVPIPPDGNVLMFCACASAVAKATPAAAAPAKRSVLKVALLAFSITYLPHMS